MISKRRLCSPGLRTHLDRLALMRLPAAFGLALASLAGAIATPAYGHDHAPASSAERKSPLIDRVRQASRRFLDINVATGENWVQATPCVSGPNEGAMGVHFLLPERLHDGKINPDEPEMLIYEPMPGGKFRLVGVEYLVLESEWSAGHKPGEAPSVDGHLMNYVSAPNRYALPAFYEMHVWAWQDNPNGGFADWNSRVTCANQARQI